MMVTVNLGRNTMRKVLFIQSVTQATRNKDYEKTGYFPGKLGYTKKCGNIASFCKHNTYRISDNLKEHTNCLLSLTVLNVELNFSDYKNDV